MGEDASRTGWRMPILTGEESEWRAWNVKFLGLLIGADLLDALRKPMPDAASDERPEWEKNAKKIYSKLSQCTSDAALDVVEQYKEAGDDGVEFNGVAAYNALKEKYEPRGLVGQTDTWKAFRMIELGDEEDPDKFFATIEDLQRRLRSMGQPIAEKTLVLDVLSKLPKAYSVTKAVLKMDNGLTYQELKQAIRTHYHSEIKNAQPGSEKSFFGMSQRGGGRGGRGGGNRGRGRGKGRGNSGSQNGQGAGDGGGRGRGQGDRGRGSRGRGGGGPKGRGCFLCGEAGHIVDGCPLNPFNKNSINSATGNSADRSSAGGGGVDWSVAAMERHHDRDQAVISERLETGSTWLLDGGSTAHATPNAALLTDVKPYRGVIVVGNGQEVQAVARGTLVGRVRQSHGKHIGMRVADVLVAPGLAGNILSTKKLSRRGMSFVSTAAGTTLEYGGLTVRAREERGLDWLDVEPMTDGDGKQREEVHAAATPWMVHQRLGHLNFDYIKELGALGVGGVPANLKVPEGKCETCELGKHKRISLPGHVERHSKAPFERVHTDLWGPAPEPTLKGSRYAILFTCEFTRWRMVYLMKSKSEVLDKFKQFVQDVSGLARGARVKELNVYGLHSDNGLEFLSRAFTGFCKEKGILQTTGGTYTPEQNGIAERSWRTVVEMARCLRIHSGLPQKFWGEAMLTAVHLINRQPTKALNGSTPYHALFGRHADLGHLRVWGCRAYVHEPVSGKLDPRAWAGILVGYEGFNRRCYRIYDPASGTVQQSVQVSFDEGLLPGRQLSAHADLDDIGGATPERQAAERNPPPERPPPHEGQGGSVGGSVASDAPTGAPGQASEQRGPAPVGAPPTAPLPPRAERELQRLAGGGLGSYWEQGGNRTTRARGSQYCQDPHCEERQHERHHTHSAVDYISAMVNIDGVLTPLNRVLSSPSGPTWQKAFDEEIQAQLRNGTWTLVERTPDMKVIKVRLLGKTKLDEQGQPIRHKGRLVAIGCMQPIEESGDTSAPVHRLSSLRTALALATVHDWHTHQMDVETAFLNAPIEGDVYIEQPPGYEQYGPNGEELVCKLNKCIYGLRDSPHNWHKMIDRWLHEYGLRATRTDVCVYIMGSPDDENTGILIVLLYVDDLVVIGSKLKTIQGFKDAISKAFKVKDMGELRFVLGMEVLRDRARRTLELRQTAYLDRIVERFGMENCRPTKTPAEVGLQLPRLSGGDGHYNSDYMSLVGSIQYAATCTRPDLAYIAQVLSRHMQASGEEHWIAAKRVLRYIKGTRTLGLKFSGTSSDGGALEGFAMETELEAYSDADWGGDRATGRSTTGYLFKMAGAGVSWASKLQQTVALSSMESEYMAATAAVQEAVYLRRLLEEMGFVQTGPTVIKEDNQSCIAFSSRQVDHQRTKHIDLKYHFTRDYVSKGVVRLEYVPTGEQQADLLTKALSGERTIYLRDRALGYKLI